MKKLLFLLLCCAGLSAGTVRLYNDSPYKLRAVIRGSDGTFLGEMIILPENFNTWTDQYSSFGPSGQDYDEQTLTPYTVQWYCMNGDPYGICTDVATGAAVLAESCSGPRICKPPKKKKGPPGKPSQDEEQLHGSEEVDSQNGGS